MPDRYIWLDYLYRCDTCILYANCNAFKLVECDGIYLCLYNKCCKPFSSMLNFVCNLRFLFRIWVFMNVFKTQEVEIMIAIIVLTMNHNSQLAEDMYHLLACTLCSWTEMTLCYLIWSPHHHVTLYMFNLFICWIQSF